MSSITIVNDGPDCVASLTEDSRGIIYYCNVFIVHARGWQKQSKFELFCCAIGRPSILIFGRIMSLRGENKSQYNLQKEKREKGATTLAITTLAITTPSIMALRIIIISIMVLRMMMLRIMTISIIILSIMKVNIMQSAY